MFKVCNLKKSYFLKSIRCHKNINIPNYYIFTIISDLLDLFYICYKSKIFQITKYIFDIKYSSRLRDVSSFM